MAVLSRVLASALGGVLSWLDRRRLPQVSGALRLRGLEGPVEVIRDRWGVPHIYAQNTHDLMFAQGYVHAQDRLWQMDSSRRLVSGRLAEVLGAVALPLDRWVRILGLRRAAEACLALVEGEPKAWVEAYAAGVNACMAREPLPIECTLLRYHPEPWTVVDTLSWGKMLAWNLSTNWDTELLRARLIARLGPEQAALLEPPYPGRCPYIVPPGVDYSGLGDEALRRARGAARYSGPPPSQGLGSNSWALAGSRTASGRPILANDMHLVMGIPAIWYENHLVGGGLDACGVTFPGVVAGHNGHVAWGFTNGFPDVQDLYIEHLRRLDDGRVQYEFRGEWLDAQVVREEVRVRGGQSVTEEVIITRHGPIINSLAPDLAGEQPLALRWTGHDPDAIIRALHGMNRAQSCLEFYEALRHWSAPVQNTVYADTAGNIGFCHAGKVPIRAKGDGRVPVPGWSGEYEWVGYIPFEELPHLYNPPEGYIVTANNRVVDDDYPYHLGTDHCPGDRAQRIRELIEARERIDLAYVREMQFDQLSVAARAVAGLLARLQLGDEDLGPILQLFGSWDGRLEQGSVAAALYESFGIRFVELALADRLGGLTSRYLGKGPTPVLAETTMLGCRALEWLERVLAEPATAAPGLLDEQERDRLVARALREVAERLREELGPDMAGWTWGRLHRLTFGHMLGSVQLLAPFFNRGPYPLGGDANTLWATGPSNTQPRCETITGPAFRFIADLGDLRNSLGLLAPGQSGHPASPHYDDQIGAWFTRGYHPMLCERKAVEQEAEARLLLE